MEPELPPVAGVDYPASFEQFEEWFATEASCQ